MEAGMRMHEIIGELRGLGFPGDVEAQHARADKLLVEALREIYDYAQPHNYFMESEVEELIAAYEAVPKWYA
jgi:hypothetical protein